MVDEKLQYTFIIAKRLVFLHEMIIIALSSSVEREENTGIMFSCKNTPHLTVERKSRKNSKQYG